MAITQTQQLPAPFITALGEKYGAGLAGLADQPFTTAQLGQIAPQVAPQTALQQEATARATAGLGAYQPYLTGAATAGAAPGAAPMGLEAYGALGTAAGLTGPMTTAQTAAYMSPYQQSVIDATMASYGQQEAIRETELQSEQARLGVLGAGRAGIQRAAYQTQSDLNRAALLSGLQQQGFGQAQAARQQDYLNQMGMSQAQQGLGQYQTALGQQTQALGGVDVGLAGQVGAVGQAQEQAIRDAQREANRMTLYEPYERLGFFGQGLTGLMGGYPAQYQSQIQPNPTPLQSALGIGSVLGGIYGNIRGRQT
jgi:hypothetical protein